MTLAPDPDRIPILLLTGYLGAGKTTLLNHLLRSPLVRQSVPALVINEFGRLGVDGHLVPPEARRYEINQGSLFCTCTRAQFVQALTGIAAAGRHRLVLIDATGIAETRNLEGQLAIPQLTEPFRIQGTLCVVDAANFVKVVCGQISERDATPSLGRATAFTAIGWRLSRIELAYAWEKCHPPGRRPASGTRPRPNQEQECPC